ncbi:hypothetical protein D3C72_1974160 [compost metagenome]
MIGEAQIVVAGEGQIVAAADADARPLRAVQYRALAQAVFGLQLRQRTGELIGTHAANLSLFNW